MIKKNHLISNLFAILTLFTFSCSGGGGSENSSEAINLGTGEYAGRYSIIPDDDQVLICGGQFAIGDLGIPISEVLVRHQGNRLTLYNPETKAVTMRGSVSEYRFYLESADSVAEYYWALGTFTSEGWSGEFGGSITTDSFEDCTFQYSFNKQKVEHSGNVSDRAAITGKLDGKVVDEYGYPLEGVNVSAYGMNTITDASGSWTLSDVPITGLMISSVYDIGSSTTLPTEGKIYTTFSKAGYATFHSTYEGALALITHSGDGSGPNSIVVSGISATIPYVELPKMNRTFTGTVYDTSTFFRSPVVGEFSPVTADVQMRLIPNYVDDDLYGFDGDTTDSLASEEFSPGYYGVDPVTVGLDGDGKFTITGVGALRSGYELRVDGTGWRPSKYPHWDTGNQQTPIRVFNANNVDLDDVRGGVAGQTNPGGSGVEDGAYWKIEKLNITTGTNSLVTDFGKLYAQNFEAQEGIDPKVAFISFLGGPDNLDASGGRDFHGEYAVINSDMATDLGNTIQIIVVFDQDMAPIDGNIIDTYGRAIILFYENGNIVDISSAILDGRTLTITTTATMAEGNYFLRLHRDVFVDMNSERLAASGGGDFYSEFGIQYGDRENSPAIKISCTIFSNDMTGFLELNNLELNTEYRITLTDSHGVELMVEPNTINSGVSNSLKFNIQNMKPGYIVALTNSVESWGGTTTTCM